jgi:hypothetical protein
MPIEVREYRAGGFNLHGGLTRGAHFPLDFALGHLGWFVRARGDARLILVPIAVIERRDIAVGSAIHARPLSGTLPSAGADARMFPWSIKGSYLDFTP